MSTSSPQADLRGERMHLARAAPRGIRQSRGDRRRRRPCHHGRSGARAAAPIGTARAATAVTQPLLGKCLMATRRVVACWRGGSSFTYCSVRRISPPSRLSMMERAVNAPMQIVLEGLPERVQEAADALDRMFPGLVTWRRFAEPRRGHAVRLEGEAAERHARSDQPAHLTNRAPPSGKAWTLGPAPGRASPPPGGRFCASLSKSLPS